MPPPYVRTLQDLPPVLVGNFCSAGRLICVDQNHRGPGEQRIPGGEFRNEQLWNDLIVRDCEHVRDLTQLGQLACRLEAARVLLRGNHAWMFCLESPQQIIEWLRQAAGVEDYERCGRGTLGGNRRQCTSNTPEE